MCIVYGASLLFWGPCSTYITMFCPVAILYTLVLVLPFAIIPIPVNLAQQPVVYVTNEISEIQENQSYLVDFGKPLLHYNSGSLCPGNCPQVAREHHLHVAHLSPLGFPFARVFVFIISIL